MNDPKNPSPYDAPELYDLLFDTLDFDIPYRVDVARAAGGPVLEAACGTGRLLFPIIKAGCAIDGFDASPAMIARLKEKAGSSGLAVRADVADMRDFTMGRRYARIFCGFNGFAHCATIDDQLAFLRRSLEHLDPGGALVLHMSYPGPAYWSEPEGAAVLEHETPRPGGGKLQLVGQPKKKYRRSTTGFRDRDLGARRLRPAASRPQVLDLPALGLPVRAGASLPGGRLRPLGHPRRLLWTTPDGARRPDDRLGLQRLKHDDEKAVPHPPVPSPSAPFFHPLSINPLAGTRGRRVRDGEREPSPPRGRSGLDSGANLGAWVLNTELGPTTQGLIPGPPALGRPFPGRQHVQQLLLGDPEGQRQRPPRLGRLELGHQCQPVHRFPESHRLRPDVLPESLRPHHRRGGPQRGVRGGRPGPALRGRGFRRRLL